MGSAQRYDWKEFKELETGGIIRENLYTNEGDSPKFYDDENDLYIGSYHIHPEHGPLQGATWLGEESTNAPLYPVPDDYYSGQDNYFRSILFQMLLKNYPSLPSDEKLPSEIIAEAQQGELSPETEEIIRPTTYTERNEKGVLILDENDPSAYTGYPLGLTRLMSGPITDEILDREFDYFEEEPSDDDSDTIQDSNLFYTTAFEGDWHEIWMRKDLSPGTDGYTELGANFECFYVEDGKYRNVPDWKTLEVMLAERNMTYENVVKLGTRGEIDQEWKNMNEMLPSRASEWSQYTKANAGYEPVAPFQRDPADYAMYDEYGNFTGEFKDSAFSGGQTYLEKQRVRFENQMINPNGDEGNIRIMLKGVWRKLPTDGDERNDIGDGIGVGVGNPEAKAIIEMYVADKWPDYLKYTKRFSSYALINRTQEAGGLSDSPVFFDMKVSWGSNNYPEGVRIWNDFEHPAPYLTFEEYKTYLQDFNDCWNQPHLIAAGEPPGSLKYYNIITSDSDISMPLMRQPDPGGDSGNVSFAVMSTEEQNTWAQTIEEYVIDQQQVLTNKYNEIEGLYNLALNVMGEEGEKINGKLLAFSVKKNFKFGKKKRRKKFGYDWPNHKNYKGGWRQKGTAKEIINKAYKKAPGNQFTEDEKKAMKSHFKWNGGSLSELSATAKTQMTDIGYSYEAAGEAYADGREELANWLTNFTDTYDDVIAGFSDEDQASAYFTDTYAAVDEITTDWIDNLREIYSDITSQMRTYVDLDQELFENAEAAIRGLADGSIPGDWSDRVRVRDYWLGSGKNNPDNRGNNDSAIDPLTVSRPELDKELRGTGDNPVDYDAYKNMLDKVNGPN